MAQRRPVSVSPALTLSTNTVAKRAFEMQMTFLRMMTFRYVVLVAIRFGVTERDREREVMIDANHGVVITIVARGRFDMKRTLMPPNGLLQSSCSQCSR